jgi:lipopolysaccharide heptosyltransferase II
MKQYKNILVNALVNLGDVVLTTSAAALLKQVYPTARITMLARPVVSDILEDNAVIDDVISFDYKAKKNSLAKMMEMAKKLHDCHFDLSISFDRKLRPALLCWLAHIPTRVGPDKVFDDKPSRVTWLYTDVVHITHDLEHTLQRETYQQIVRGFTGKEGSASPVLARIKSSNEAKADMLLSLLPAAKKYIGLCVKGTFPLKTWPKEYFAQVVGALAQDYDASFFIVGAPSDKAYANEVVRIMPMPVANFCGETSLVDLEALLGRADLFVTVDTGAAHIAAASGVPMVVMYGCTSPARWHPASERARVLTTAEACCPCKSRPEECPSWPQPKCLCGITPEMVLKQCEELLELEW